MDDGNFEKYNSMSVRPLYDFATACRHWTNDFVLMGNVK